MDHYIRHSLFYSALIFSQQALASGPWNLGPFSTKTFSSAYVACEDVSKTWALQKSVNLDSISVSYTQKQIASPFQASAICNATGNQGSLKFQAPAANLFLTSNFDPGKCDLFNSDGSCYFQNDKFNQGKPIASELADCANKYGPNEGVGNPINLATGNKFQHEKDFQFYGNDVSLSLDRNYNSSDLKVGPFGLGWSTTFNSFVQEAKIYNTKTPVASDTPAKVLMTVKTADGRQYEFEKNNAQWLPSKNITARLELLGNEYRFTDDARNQLFFSQNGFIQRQTNTNGLSLYFQYNSANQVKSMSDDFGNAISFGYRGDGLIDSATISEFGTVNYAYDKQRLISATFNSSQPGAIPVIRAYVYDDPNFAHLLTGIIDENNQRFATWRYDSIGRAISSEHGDNGAEKTTIDYLSAYSTKVTNALGREKTYTLVDIYGVKQILNATEKATTHCPAANQYFTYDGRGFLETHTNGENSVSRYIRNDKGLVTKFTRGLGWKDAVGGTLLDDWAAEEVSTEWYDDFNLPKLVTIRGKNAEYIWQDYKKIDYKHDAFGRISEQTTTDLTTFTQPYSTAGRSRTVTFTYNYNSNLPTVSSLVINGPRAPMDIAGGQDDITTFTYNTRGLLTEKQDSLGYKVSFQDFNILGLPKTTTDKNGVIKNIAYDSQGFIDTITLNTEKGPAITDYDFYPNGLLKKLTAGDKASIAYTYNPASQVTAIENNFGEVIALSPNTLHGDWETRTIKSSDATISETHTRRFDELGRVRQIVGNDKQSRIIKYDSLDQVFETNDEGHTKYPTLLTNYYPDQLGRVYEIIDAKDNSTLLDYDGQNNLVSVTNANGHKTQYIVDGFGQVIWETSPDRGIRDYRYDPAGNLTEIKDAKGTIFTLQYDALDRLVSRANSAGDTTKWIYDLNDAEHTKGIGRLSKVSNGNSVTDYGYNALGLVIKETTSIQLAGKSPIKATTLYDFDLAGNLSATTYPDGHIVSFIAKDGRTSGITMTRANHPVPASLLTSIKFAPFGQPTSYQFGNGIVNTKTIDLDGRVNGLLVSNSEKQLLNISYGFDAFNNINAISYANDTKRNKAIEYDQFQQIENFTSEIIGNTHFTYDPVGNRLTRDFMQGSSKFTDTYQYPWANNRLGAITNSASANKNRTYTYDDNGNVSSVAKSGSTLTLSHDPNNQLQSVTVSPAN